MCIFYVELFLDLALDNAALHGHGDSRVDCHFDGQTLIIDVNNRIGGTENSTGKVKPKRDRLQHREFSTCLGNHDLILVCSKRQIPFEVQPIPYAYTFTPHLSFLPALAVSVTTALAYVLQAHCRAELSACVYCYSHANSLFDHLSICIQCGAGDDGRWHTSIQVSAARVSSTKEVTAESIHSPKLVPRNLRIAVVDDIRMIVRLCTMQLKKQLNARVEGYHVDTLSAYNEFANVTIPKNKCGWDIVILDQVSFWVV